MALSKLDSLYMAVVADHSKNPHHHGKIEGVEQINLNNPTCGDVISLSVQFDDKGVPFLKWIDEWSPAEWIK